MCIVAFWNIRLLLASSLLYAQNTDTIPIPPKPTMQEIMKDWGPNDSLRVQAIWYGTDYNDFKMMPMLRKKISGCQTCRFTNLPK